VSLGHASPATTVDTIGARVQSAAGEIAAHADEHDRDASYPADGIAALWRAGLGNLTLSTEHGGDGLSLLETARAVRGIGAADASVALIWVMHLIHLALVEDPRFGLSTDARDTIIGSSLQGPALINALRVEPELGTPGRGGVPATTATPTGPNAGNAYAARDWRLTGHKIYCTGSHGLRWLLVWASVASEDPDEIRVGPFVVDAEAPGIEVRETWDHLGMRASASHDMILTDATVPAGWTGALEPVRAASPAGRDPVAVAAMNLLLTSLYLGVAEASRERLADYLHERVPTNLGAPLSSLPRFQAAVGELETSLITSRRLLDGLAHDLDAGGEQARGAAPDSGPIKATVSRAVIAAAEQAVALVGNPGLSRHLPLQRHMRDALCSRIHSPQDDSILADVGRRTLARGRD
jgi:alkylation response protein AidB-like acyl-CoA dehydrogenase